MDYSLEIKFQDKVPRVGKELNPMVDVNYVGMHGMKFGPSNFTVVLLWSRELYKQIQNNEVFTIINQEQLHQPKLWIQVASSRTYIPSKDDIGYCLRLVSYVVNDMNIIVSPSCVFVTSPVRPTSPSPRTVVPTLSGLKRLAKPDNIGGFRVLSYNILADMYINTGRYQYEYCPPEDLTWEYRRKNLLSEILSYDADILCLQEVQSDHFKNFFEPQLSRFGYSSIYKKKTKEPVHNGKEIIVDGCATFFRSEKFELLRRYEVEFKKMALELINKLQPEKRKGGASRLMKDNIATVLILQEKKNFRSKICVANTHINSGKGTSDVRLFQVIKLINGLEKIDALGIPVILCGDMNSAPGSDPHAFLLDGKVGYFRQEKRDVLGISNFLKLRHSMHLANAYSETCDLHENETLDYILYSEDKLKIDGVLEIPAYESIGKKRLLPTSQWSSDHLALVANLRVRKGFRQNYSPLPPNPWERLAEVKSVMVKQQRIQRSKEIKPNAELGGLWQLPSLAHQLTLEAHLNQELRKLLAIS